MRRRSQQERSESTQTALLQATVRCLGRDGYADTSISSIIAEAGVSRGALLHHYPTKNELIASAIVWFYRQRLNRFKEKLLGADTDRLSLEDRMLKGILATRLEDRMLDGSLVARSTTRVRDTTRVRA